MRRNRALEFWKKGEYLSLWNWILILGTNQDQERCLKKTLFSELSPFILGINQHPACQEFKSHFIDSDLFIIDTNQDPNMLKKEIPIHEFGSTH